MFDVWIGDMNFGLLILVIAAVVVLPVQLLLCFKVKSLVIRLMPIIILFMVIVVIIVTNLDTSGWDGLVFIFDAIYAAFMVLMCGIGWGVWAIVRFIKRRRNL